MAETQNRYAYPVELTENVRVTYDASPAHKDKLIHAVHFIIPEGTPIMASLDGIVVDVKQDSDLGGVDEKHDTDGNYIEIEHPDGEYSIYEHIRQNGSLVGVGDRVKQGQVIGSQEAPDGLHT
jgi:murein DD-endopeptidase MepM/ murein hydrolase activator NlpD